MTSVHIRWIVTDLDGTLVDTDQRIVERSKTALATFCKAGGEVFLATGRNETSATRFHTELGLHTPAILYNGARVVDLISGEVLYANEIGGAFDRLQDRVLQHLPAHVGAVAFVADAALVVHDAPALADYARRDRLDLQPVSVRMSGESVIKVLLVSDRPDLAPLAAVVADTCPDLVTVASEPTYLELLAPRTSKGVALQWLAQQRGIDLAHVAAIGDNDNDAAMIRLAGIGAVPTSAHAGMHAQADLIVRRCADGAVADVVEYALSGCVRSPSA